MVSLTAIHEHRFKDLTAGQWDLVLHTTTHPEQTVEGPRLIEVVMLDDHVTQSALSGQKTAEHSATGVKRQVRVYSWTVKDFQRITGRILERDELQHRPVTRQVSTPLFEAHIVLSERLLQIPKLLRAGHSKTDADEIVCWILVEDDPVMPVIETQVEPIPFAFGMHLQSNEFLGKGSPGCQV